MKEEKNQYTRVINFIFFRTSDEGQIGKRKSAE
jgi:hypothetical protein